MRLVRRPASASRVSASYSKTWPTQAVGKPACSSSAKRSSHDSRSDAPRVETKIPMRIGGSAARRVDPQRDAPAVVESAAMEHDRILLTNKIAIVTGAGSGIGQGIARGFAAFGAKLALLEI